MGRKRDQANWRGGQGIILAKIRSGKNEDFRLAAVILTCFFSFVFVFASGSRSS